MGYIGKIPSAVPLTSADITDGIITSAKIADGTIVNDDINASAAIASTKLSGITSPAAFRNLIINGDMQVAQRNTSVASITTTGYYTLDRFKFLNSSLGTFTMSQSTDVPSGYGFVNSLKLDNTTADSSPSTGDYLAIIQSFEGQNLQYLKKGTANAVSLTASFWVKSTKTGTFICELEAGTRSISKSYTVSASNTWEFKTITFAGDTSGTITNNNASGMTFYFWLGAGSDFTSGTLATSWGTQTNANRAVGQANIADNTANDFFITGVQLEAGTSATDFEFLPYDVSLARCFRYYQKLLADSGYTAFGSATIYSASLALTLITYKQQMRSSPTIAYSGTIMIQQGSTNKAVTSLTSLYAGKSSLYIECNASAGGMTIGYGAIVQANSDANAYFELSSEL